MRTKFAYVGRGVLNLVVVLAVVFGLQPLIRGRVSDTLGLIALSSVLVVSYVAGVRWIERRQASELIAAAGFTEFAAGLALGLALFTTLMLLLWMFGAYRPSGWGSVAPIAGGLLLALLTAILEEILFRGFLFRLSAKLLGTWGALALTSALFGAAHSFNPGATVGGQLRRHRARSWCPARCGLCLDAALVVAHRTASGLELRGSVHLRNVGLGW
jgi:hypothetical protein